MTIIPNPELRVQLLSSLEKVFPDRTPESCLESNRFSVLGNDAVSFQVGLYPHNSSLPFHINIAVESPLAEHLTIRSVNNVASTYTAHPFFDDNYLMTAPGIVPDLLLPLYGENYLQIAPRQWAALWVELNVPAGYPSGMYPVTLSFRVPANAFGVEEEIQCALEVEIEVLPADLPEQKLLCTHWLYADCIADYYDVAVFSEDHWRLLEMSVASAVRMGNNVLLTPIFTPPINTEPGYERMTVQLIDMAETGGRYSFGFEKLRRWVKMAQRVGITHFEMAHLFTQWGAEYTPKIVVNGEKRFGWHVRADSEQYKSFIDQFLPALVQELKEMGIANCTLFHISDEPDETMYDSYGYAVSLVKPYLQDFPIIDALSDYGFYSKGMVNKPIPATDHIDPFLESKVPGLWAYYCIAQMMDVSNRFMGMPSSRNRIIGVQLYKYGIEGFLHWGFNFYNTSMSIGSVNPFISNDAGQGFVSGDSFVVYPGKRGEPLESIRYMVFREAMLDIRALQLLEGYIGREAVINLLEEEAIEPITFSRYPKSQGYLIRLREKVNRAIAAQQGKPACQ